MKRIITMVIVVLLAIQSVCVAEQGEIKFRNLEWGCSVKEAKNILKKQGGKDLYTYDNWAIPNISDIYDVYYFDSVQDGGCLMMLSIDKVAGYKTGILGTRLYFSYGVGDDFSVDRDETSLYLAEYEFDIADCKSAYKDLKDKLSSQYGDGKYSKDVDEVWSTAVGHYTKTNNYILWDGANNTSVLLVYVDVDDKHEDGEFAKDYIQIKYFKSDSAAQIERLKKAIINEKFLLEESNRDASDTDGL